MGTKTTGKKSLHHLAQRGGVWWVVWSRNGVRQQVSTGIPVGTRGEDAVANREKAMAARDEVMHGVGEEDTAEYLAGIRRREERARDAARMDQRIPLEEAWDRFPYTKSQPGIRRKAGQPLKPSNVQSNYHAWNKFVTWALSAPTTPDSRTRAKLEASKHVGGKVCLQDVTRTMAEEYSAWLEGEGLTPSRRRVLLLVANVMFRLAGLPSPFEGLAKQIELQQPVSRKPFTPEEVVRLLETASGEWRAWIGCLYYSGLRCSDVCNLTYENRVVEGGVRKLRLRTGKTGTDICILEHPSLTEIFDEVLERHPVDEFAYLFPTIQEQHAKDPTGLSRRFVRHMEAALGEYVQGEDGEQTLVAPASRKARRLGEGVRAASVRGIHSMRHSLATAAANAGVPMPVLQQWLGHGAEVITRIYAAHSSAEAQARLVEAVTLPTQGHPLPPPAVPKALLGDGGSDVRSAVAEALAVLEGMDGNNWSEKRDAAVAILKKTQEGA